jgi:hypothetical protein
MAITTENYLKDLIKQKENLVSTLQECGVEASKDEKFNTLVPKVKGLEGNLIFKGTIADELEIEGNLSHESLMSIINALKDFSGTETFANVEAWFDGPEDKNPKEDYVYNVISVTASVDNGLCISLEADTDLMLIVYGTNYSGDVTKIKTAMISNDGILTLTTEPTTTKTLTLGATNLAKLTDEEKAIATNKGWTLA